ncbi:MAG: lytic transglycosylase domain-containing protein [Gemmatimonadota bacterium]
MLDSARAQARHRSHAAGDTTRRRARISTWGRGTRAFLIAIGFGAMALPGSELADGLDAHGIAEAANSPRAWPLTAVRDATAPARTRAGATPAALQRPGAVMLSHAFLRSPREGAIEVAMDRFGIARDLAEDIHDMALAEGVDPSIAFGLVFTESSFRERVVSYAGALGLTQVLPTTAVWILDEQRDADSLFERDTNLRAGFRYLSYLLERYDGDLHLALLAYNRGPGTVERVLRRGRSPDNGYADRVLEHAV